MADGNKSGHPAENRGPESGGPSLAPPPRNIPPGKPASDRGPGLRRRSKTSCRFRPAFPVYRTKKVRLRRPIPAPHPPVPRNQGIRPANSGRDHHSGHSWSREAKLIPSGDRLKTWPGSFGIRADDSPPPPAPIFLGRAFRRLIIAIDCGPFTSPRVSRKVRRPAMRSGKRHRPGPPRGGLSASPVPGRDLPDDPIDRS